MMKKIKLAHVVNFDLGLKIHIGNYLRYQREQGYDVSIVCHPGKWITRDTTIQDDIFVKVIPFEPRISPIADLQTLVRLVAYFRQERFDIVHTSTVKPGLLGRMAARLTGAPVVVHTWRGLFLHPMMSPMQYQFFANIEKFACALSDSVLSQNKEDIETAARLGICPPEKTHYLGNGIDLSRFYPGSVPAERVEALRTQLNIPAGMPVVGIVARLVREKGIFEFMEAVRLLKAQGVKARYLAVGSSQKDKISQVSPEGFLQEHGLQEDVMLLGHRDDVPDLLTLMDVLVLPSYAEGIPRILMEAAAIGKPVVASRVRGTIEVVEDGVTGLLVPMQDAPALADGLQQILSDPARAASLGQHARQRALAHFDERRYFWKTDAEYRRLLRAKLSLDTNSMLKPIPAA